MSCCHAQMQSRSGAAALETAEGSMEGAGADLSRQVSLFLERKTVAVAAKQRCPQIAQASTVIFINFVSPHVAEFIAVPSVILGPAHWFCPHAAELALLNQSLLMLTAPAFMLPISALPDRSLLLLIPCADMLLYKVAQPGIVPLVAGAAAARGAGIGAGGGGSGRGACQAVRGAGRLVGRGLPRHAGGLSLALTFKTQTFRRQ